MRVFEDVKIGPSPLWLKARLSAAGQRPISNVVDITNYVMLLTGQPLHAFDLDKVRGGRLRVHRAEDGQKMRTLDGTERTLDSSMALISDAEGPTSHRRRDGRRGLRGLRLDHARRDGGRHLGRPEHHAHAGEARACAARRARASRRACTRSFAMAAQRLAARLMVELCGARMVPGTVDEYPSAGRAARRAAAHSRASRSCSG